MHVHTCGGRVLAVLLAPECSVGGQWSVVSGQWSVVSVACTRDSRCRRLDLTHYTNWVILIYMIDQS